MNILFATLVAITNCCGSITVETRGARMVSYVPAVGEEVLARLSDGSGGIPLCWPWFANDGPTPDCRRHGCIRDREFAIVRRTTDELVLRLVSDGETRRHFPHDFELTLAFRLGAALEISLTGRNTGGTPFPVTEMFSASEESFMTSLPDTVRSEAFAEDCMNSPPVTVRFAAVAELFSVMVPVSVMTEPVIVPPSIVMPTEMVSEA